MRSNGISASARNGWTAAALPRSAMNSRRPTVLSRKLTNPMLENLALISRAGPAACPAPMRRSSRILAAVHGSALAHPRPTDFARPRSVVTRTADDVESRAKQATHANEDLVRSAATSLAEIGPSPDIPDLPKVPAPSAKGGVRPLVP